MTESEIEKLLKKISTQKMYGEIDKAIANLHILNNEFPNEKKYLALLASAYMEVGSDDGGIEYCNKALKIDPDYPQAFELKGLLAEKEGNKKLAEDYYKKSIDKNIFFRGGHVRLLQLYYVEERYEEAVKEGEFLLSNFDVNRESFSPENKRSLAVNWLSFAYMRTISSLIRLNKYDDAIQLAKESIDFRKDYIKDQFHFHSDDELLFKLYYLTHNLQMLEEFKNKWLNFHKVPEHRILSMQKDVDQGYIEQINPENYSI